MSEKQGVLDGIVKTIQSLIFDRFLKDIDVRIRSYIIDFVKSVIRRILLAFIGAILALTGIVFICISLVNYIQIFVNPWIAWLLVGLAVLVVGSIMSIMTLARR